MSTASPILALSRPPCPQRLHEFLPDAKMAHIKEGGDFPFISRPADVALYILVHLRSHGAAVASPAGAAAESKQGSVAAPRTGSSSSSSSTAAAAPFPSTTRIPNSVSDLKRPDKGSQAEARSSGASTSETKSNPEGSGPAQNPAATDAPKSKPPASALDGEVDDEVWDALGLGGARGAPAKAGTGEGGKHASAVEGSAAKKTDVAADLDLDVSLDLNTV